MNANLSSAQYLRRNQVASLHRGPHSPTAWVDLGLDPNLYIMYSSRMAPTNRKGTQEARAQLPALLADAERGRITIITKRGRPIAALVPIAQVAAHSQRSLLTLAGTGVGLWGKDSSRRLARLRDEWS